LMREAEDAGEIIFLTFISDTLSAVKTANFAFTVECKGARQSTNPPNGVQRTLGTVAGVMGFTCQLS